MINIAKVSKDITCSSEIQNSMVMTSGIWDRIYSGCADMEILNNSEKWHVCTGTISIASFFQNSQFVQKHGQSAVQYSDKLSSDFSRNTYTEANHHTWTSERTCTCTCTLYMYNTYRTLGNLGGNLHMCVVRALALRSTSETANKLPAQGTLVFWCTTLCVKACFVIAYDPGDRQLAPVTEDPCFSVCVGNGL